MSKKPVLLVEPPVFWEDGGLFYLDLGIEKFPVLAYKPSGLLAATRQAMAVYQDWLARQDGKVCAGRTG